MTVLSAEQNINHALGIYDRATVLELGEIVLMESADELIGRPDIEDLYLGRSAAYPAVAGRTP